MHTARNTKRNWGIDLLRIVCMLMVPILHVLRNGGVLAATEPLSASYEVARLLNDACFCAVNCFALISGYVGYGSRHRFSGLFHICFQALFYTLGWTAAFLIVKPELVNRAVLFKALLPFIDSYWYLTAYFCLFFFMPYLDSIVRGLSKGGTRKLIAATVFVFSLLPTLLQFIASALAIQKLGTDLAKTSSGYSFIWLAALYVLGACIKKLDITASRRRCIVGFLASVALSWGWQLVADVLRSVAGIERLNAEILTSYTSPTVLGCAVCLLLLFSRLELPKRAIAFVRVFAPLSFGVYLFHVEPLPWDHILKGAFAQIGSLPAPLMAGAVLLAATGIWLAGSTVDFIRSKLFDLLRVNSMCNGLGGRMDRVLLPSSDNGQKPN